MTKARDLAGFSTSSITNTATDGLVLAGDGSSTDVVIKNGANATVATVADGTTNLSVAGSVTGALARGAIQVGDSSGVSSALTAGGADTVLTSDGTDLSWVAAAPSGGSMEFIASSGALSAASDVAFTQFDSSKYDSYEFNLLNVKPSTNATTLVAEASTDGGSSYDGSTSGNYHDAPSTDRANFAVTPSGTGVGNGTNEFGATGRFLINNPARSAYTYTQFLGMSMNSDVSGAIKACSADQNCASIYLNTAEVNAIKFKFASGNIASGEIVMYGIKNS